MSLLDWMSASTKAAALGLMLAIAGPAIADEPAASPRSPTLDDLVAGKLQIVDLAWPLNEKAAYWPGERYTPFRLDTIATLEKDGVLSKSFSTPEHLGTHIDAPNHFAQGQISVDKIPSRDLFAPGVMIDALGPASADADYRLSVVDIEHWEKLHGRIPDGAVVLLNTGWSRHWGNAVRFQNRDVQGRMHFPGFSPEGAKFLVDQRHVRGIGIDTMSIDYGLSHDFAVHKIVNGAGRYGLENVAQLDRVPPRGFYVFVAPIKIESGSGGPARIFAILDRGE